ncbi:MAG: hypothetical protein MZW92_12800 [Comamonadaceae bacterium]|nr:hypothetical protein [Comamonadaceae bacterium]
MRDDPLDRRFVSYAAADAHAAVRRQQACGHAPILVGAGCLALSAIPWLLCARQLRRLRLLSSPSPGCGACRCCRAGASASASPQAALVTSIDAGAVRHRRPDLRQPGRTAWQRRKPPFAVGAGADCSPGFCALAACAGRAAAAAGGRCSLAASLGAGAMAISFGFAKESAPLRAAGHGHRRGQRRRDGRHAGADAGDRPDPRRALARCRDQRRAPVQPGSVPGRADAAGRVDGRVVRAAAGDARDACSIT